MLDVWVTFANDGGFCVILLQKRLAKVLEKTRAMQWVPYRMLGQHELIERI